MVLGLESERRTVMVTGGSQGALHLDQVVAAALPSFADRGDLQLLVVTGPGRESELAGAAGRAGAARVVVVPFLDRMELGYAAADLVVRAATIRSSRSVACRRSWCRTPMDRASSGCEREGDGTRRRLVFVPDAELSPAVFATTVLELVDDPDRLASMGARATGWAKPDAAERFASLVAEAVRT